MVCMLFLTKVPSISGYLSTSSQAKNISNINVNNRAIINLISRFNRPYEDWVKTKKSFVKNAKRIDVILANTEDNIAE